MVEVVHRSTARLGRLFGLSLFRIGRILEPKGYLWWIVEPLYRSAGKVLADRPVVLYRLGRIRERRRRWTSAEAAYSAALALGPVDREMYIVRRAKVLERMGRWRDALADCDAVSGAAIPYLLVCRLAEHLRQVGELTEAVRLFKRPLRDSPKARYFTMAAEYSSDLGDLDNALRAYREAAKLEPDDLKLRTMLARTASQVSLVPFTLVEGGVVPQSEAVRQAALGEAADELNHILSSSGRRVWPAYWLGLLYERHGLLADAAQAYGAAVDRVATSDKPWAYNAKQAWSFRLEYVQHQMCRDRAGDRRLWRLVSCGQSAYELSGVGGYFEALITNSGLLIEGFVLNGHAGAIDVLVNGRRIISTAGNSTSWHRDFKTTIVHGVLEDFPDSSTIAVKVGSRPLVTQSGAQTAGLRVPGGSGRITEMLAKGRELTKKGRWADALLSAESSDETYLQAYEEASAFFAAQLGKKLFLSYGTLLGCYRDGRLIPGDDDFDVSYVSDATGPLSFKKEGQEILKALLEAGFDARVAIDGRMFHLRVGDSVLDVNPFWFYKGRAWAFNAHKLGREVFDPPATMVIRGARVYIPAKTELFLEENYGSEWQIPRSDFQYNRSKADRATMRRARLAPSEVQRLVAFSEELRASDERAGRFHGYGDPADPTFKDDPSMS